MQILTLAENEVHKVGLIAEHGLSFLITTSSGVVLWDVGQGYAPLFNAVMMDIDLDMIDCIALSHGHRDHTGGLVQFLDQIGTRRVFAHPDALIPKYREGENTIQEIGLSESLARLEEMGAVFCLNQSPTEIFPGVTLTGQIPRVTDFEYVGAHFLTRANGHRSQDLILDDQALIIETKSDPVVILGCAHAGVINTLLYVEKLTGTNRFSGIVGGMHLIESNDQMIKRTVEELQYFDFEMIAPCHCTGFRAQVALWEAYRERCVANAVGDKLFFE